MTPEEDKYYVLGNVLEGLALLEASNAFASVIPEVRSNLVMCLEQSGGPEDVAGVPGRITSVFGQPRAAARPAFGGSHYTARIILAARGEMANLRAALEIRYHADLVALIQRMGLAARSLESVLSGAADSEARVAGLCRIFKEVYSEQEKLSIAYTEGGQAREGAIILLGETAVEVARKAIAIAAAYANQNEDHGRS